jgi:hypothetical protein
MAADGRDTEHEQRRLALGLGETEPQPSNPPAPQDPDGATPTSRQRRSNSDAGTIRKKLKGENWSSRKNLIQPYLYMSLYHICKC